MNDAEWIKSLDTLTDPIDILQEIVGLDERVAGVGDPYYRDLYQAVIERGRQVLENRKSS